MAEKMRYENENENENAKIDDEFNNSEDDLSVEDIYRVYMEEIAAIPPCSEAENEKLLGEIRNGNKAARERLIEGNLKNALFFVQDYINKGVPMADLIQEASLELMMLADEGFEAVLKNFWRAGSVSVWRRSSTIRRRKRISRRKCWPASMSFRRYRNPWRRSLDGRQSFPSSRSA